MNDICERERCRHSIVYHDGVGHCSSKGCFCYAFVFVRAEMIADGRARCPRCMVVLNDERHPENFTDHLAGINLCPSCQSNEDERAEARRHAY